MAILTEDDVQRFAPTVNLTSDELEGAILLTQSIVEGAAGAGRTLSLSQRIDTGSLGSSTQSFFLKNYPLVIDESHHFSLSVRIGGNVTDGFGRPVPVGNWRSLNEGDYVLDDDGQVFLNYSNTGLICGGGWSGSNQHSQGFTSYKASYWAGYDFTVESDEINMLKVAAIAILKHINLSGIYKGLQEVQMPFDEYKIRYFGDPKTIGSIPADMLLPFKMLQARFS